MIYTYRDTIHTGKTWHTHFTLQIEKKRHYKFKRQITSFKMKHLFLNQTSSFLQLKKNQ
jgi:hypothetical protein